MMEYDIPERSIAALRDLWEWGHPISEILWEEVCDEIERLRARVKELEAERADLLTDEQAYWLYGMNPW